MRTRAGVGGLLAWLALVVVAAGSAGALSVYDQPAGLRLDDLDLLASPVDVPGGSIDRQIQWAVDFVNGAPVSRADLSERFAPSFLKVIPVDELLSGRDAFAHDAPYRVWAVVRKRADLATFALLGASGASYRLELAVEPPTGRIDGLALFRSDVGRQPMGRTALTLTIVAALLLAIVGNLLVRRPRGDRAVGGWFLAAAVACGAQLAQLVGRSWALSIGFAAGPVALALAAAALVRHVSSLLVRRVLAAGIVTAAALAVVGQFALPLPDGVAPLLFHLGVSRSFARTLLDVRSLAALTVAVVAGAALTVETIRRPTRRVKVLAAGGLVVAGAVASVAVAWLTHPRAVHVTMSAWLDAALAVLAVAGAVSLFVEGLELGGVARLVTDLGDVDAPMALQHSIGRALDDPSVELWFWSAGLGAYVTLDGSRGDPERTRPGRVLTRLSARDEPLAVVVHDAARDIPDHRVAAVCAAARMALDNERLHAQVRAQLADATASRARIVVAGDQARREIERNLHDGTQQRLLAVLLRLREAEERHRRAGERAGSAALADEVGLAADELAVALEELRAIARGLHPPALDHGLAAALDALAETAPLPVELHTPADLPAAGPEIEAAVYFFVAEALTNTVRHAGATHLAVTVERTASGLRATAADDGCGGAACRGGTGLARLGDRAAALGGQLRVDSRAEAGTTLVLELPTAPPGEATADVVP